MEATNARNTRISANNKVVVREKRKVEKMQDTPEHAAVEYHMIAIAKGFSLPV
jgi:hypothetical protein